ncbi:hypothetical protein MNBD_PLANCTO02-10 [hydrothermal vent metagenome]|uniref:Uncharacterized protein n=1 Tax=hydrothermal vent metagenome TaxID=652676 RepID=A0A3B1DMS3_9ZZZZ
MNQFQATFLIAVLASAIAFTPQAWGQRKKLETSRHLIWKTTKITKKDISYTLSLPKKVYRPGENIVVTSTIKNISNRKIRVRAPNSFAMIVEVYIEGSKWMESGTGFFSIKATKEEDEDGEDEEDENGEEWRGGGCGGGGPMVEPRIEELSPGETCSSEADSYFFMDGLIRGSPRRGLAAGKYTLGAVYHLVDPRGKKGMESKAYRKNIIQAKGVSFTVRELTKAEEEEWKVFQKVFDKLFPRGRSSSEPDEINDKPMRQFLKDYPDSVYRMQAYLFLAQASNGDAEELELMRQERMDGGHDKMGEELKDHLRGVEGSMLTNAGRFQEAIQVYSLSSSPNLIRGRENLEYRISLGNGQEENSAKSQKTPPATKPLSNKPATPKESSSNKIIIGVVVAFIVILLLTIIAWKFKSKKPTE